MPSEHVRDNTQGRHRRWVSRLFEPVDGASLAFFRIAFGAMMIYEMYRFISRGWYDTYFGPGQFHITFLWFEWVKPWPGDGMLVHCWVMAIAAGGVMLGVMYRFSALVLFLLWTHLWLIDQSWHNNHYYFMSLVAFLMIFVPVHRLWSVDALWRPKLRSPTAPVWALWLIRFQIGVPYCFGGLAKLYTDWLYGDVVRLMLFTRSDEHVLGKYFQEEWGIWFFTYAGLLFDLLIVPSLLWRRTRWFALGAMVIFNLSNAYMFSIGIFPWLMLAATPLFLGPSWPRKALSVMLRRPQLAHTVEHESPAPGIRARRVILAMLGVYVAVQLLVPLRHHLYPGDPNWTNEAYYFAWRMKLRVKSAKEIAFVATDPATGKTGPFDPRKHTTGRTLLEMAKNPDGVLLFAHHVGEKLRAMGHEDIEIRALIKCRMNAHPKQWLIDPKVDLLKRKLRIWPPAQGDWIVPLNPKRLKAHKIDKERLRELMKDMK